MLKSHELPNFLKDLGLRVLGTVLAVAFIVSLAYLGDFFNIEFLNSSGGLLIGTVLVMEAFFFSVILYMAVRGKI